MQTPSPNAEHGVSQLADHLFRHEAAKLVSILTGIFGIHRLQMAEDVVQESLARALQTWPFYGVPANPAAWLMQTARNLALDLIRRETSFQQKQPKIVEFIEQRLSDTATGSQPMFDEEIKDDRLRLMFACCHPQLPQEAQTALALKVLCGFSPQEIASAFLTSEVAVAKRLTRARQKLQEEQVAFEIPSGVELPTRLDSVLQILYLLFNEGYKASHGDSLIREDLCNEAIRLTTLLAGHPAGSQPRTHALLALMFLNAARLSARLDDAGNIRRLEEQDRSQWNASMIQRGILHLGLSAQGDQASEYHLQAGISACHSLAPDAASTDWPQILRLYDHLLQMNSSPVIALNRAVALAKVEGPAKGLAAVEAILDRQPLDSYHLFHAVMGELEAQRQHYQSAASHLRMALQFTEMASERSLLSKRLHEVEQQPD
ncbi:RNA polymerase sigma-70 factor (ECF subfamily) [Prosthecobacter fusiformis]|uniref:RNA polymerase sigma-70 factor (ECF subfamily) n=1 Tax=Prosthecobacter fusiformis TaxID=48464 RepID=A0A4R7RZR9_9BACT|nr:sigma-70 family RNA polymerase sigma factor [Prosthecobacter fusiformis]TDU70646.1 RNA polymerase sigma-70 factor (ECF subfamily) [Prosthecobacter fusiformis]